MNTKSTIIFILLFVFTFSIRSQDTSQVKITTYVPFGTKSVDQNKDLKIYKNNFKWNIGMLARGAFIIEYERLLSTGFTIEGGAGITYRDYILEGSLMDKNDNSIIPVSSDNDLKIKPGFSVEFAPRFYPKEGNFEGFFISPFFRYRQYNISVNNPSDDNGNIAPGTFDLGYNTTDLAFLIGFQWESLIWDTMTEYYFGVGYRNNAFKDMQSSLGSLTFSSKSSSYPCILFGVKIGFTY